MSLTRAALWLIGTSLFKTTHSSPDLHSSSARSPWARISSQQCEARAQPKAQVCYISNPLSEAHVFNQLHEACIQCEASVFSPACEVCVQHEAHISSPQCKARVSQIGAQACKVRIQHKACIAVWRPRSVYTHVLNNQQSCISSSQLQQSASQCIPNPGQGIWILNRRRTISWYPPRRIDEIIWIRRWVPFKLLHITAMNG